MNVNTKELAAGGVFFAIGAFFAGNAFFTLRMGSTLNMGPGFFPTILGTVLMILGIAIAVSGAKRPSEPLGPVPWKGLVLVIGAIVFFGAFVREVGFGPTLFLSTTAAAMSSGKLSLLMAALLGACLTLFSVAVFIYALGLPYPVVGPWLKF